MGCVYRLVNTVNDAVYIGMTSATAEKRFAQHVKASREKNRRQILTRAIAKYGVNAFEIETLFLSDCKAALFQKEIELISLHKKYGARLYNQTEGGEGVVGNVLSEEAKQKLSAASVLMWKDPEYRQRANKNKSEISKARWQDPEYRKSKCKLTPEEVREIFLAVKSGSRRKELAHKFSVSLSTIDFIIQGKRHKEITKDLRN